MTQTQGDVIIDSRNAEVCYHNRYKDLRNIKELKEEEHL